MNIAIFGWYHHQNAGDDRIQEALTRLFDGHTLAFLPIGRKVNRGFIRAYDLVIIGGGGIFQQAGGISKQMSSWKSVMGKPIIILGASIESEDGRLIEELKYAVNKIDLALFRDQGSIDMLGAGKAALAPDLSFYLPYAINESNSPNREIGLCLRNESSFDTEKWQSYLQTTTSKFSPWPFYLEQGSDIKQLQNVFPQHIIPSQFDHALTENFRMVVTGRFHGMLFAIQMGLPFVIVSSRPKVKRFLEMHDLAMYRIDENETQELDAKIAYIDEHYAAIREQLITLRLAMVDEAKFKYDGVLVQVSTMVANYPRWKKIRDKVLIKLGL